MLFTTKRHLHGTLEPEVHNQAFAPKAKEMSVAEVLEKPVDASVLCDRLVEGLSAVEVERDPFCHFYTGAFWPTNFYPRLLRNLPDPNYYEPQNIKKWVRADGTSTRDNFFLTAENIKKLPPDRAAFWTAIVDAVIDERLKRAVFAKLAPDLAQRFKIAEAEVPNIPCVHELILIRDLEDYQIKPHPDGMNKIVTLQMYLPSDATADFLGTSLYRMKKNFWGKKSFEEVKRFPFLPNSAYSFAVSDSKERTSWHGRELITNFKGVRNTLMVIFQSKTVRDYDY